MGWYPGLSSPLLISGSVRSDALGASWISISRLPPLGRGFAATFLSPTVIRLLHEASYRYKISDGLSFMDHGRCVKIRSDSKGERPEIRHDIRRAGAPRCESGTAGAHGR